MSYQVTLVGPNGRVVFDVSPTLSEDGGANYDGYSIVHLPTSLYAYRNSDGRRFGLTGQFISRNEAEAKRNIAFLDLLRSWRLPDFGSTGATPPILKLYGYKNKNIDGRQVVLTSYSFSFDSNTDYIYTVKQPMPIIGEITIHLSEVYSAEQITAGKWKMDMSSQSGISNSVLTGKLGSLVSNSIGGAIGSAISQGLPDGLSKLASGDGMLSRVGNMIENNIKTEIPGKLAGALVGAVGKQILGSSKVQEAVNHLPGVVKNVFVSGANTLINQVSKSTQNTVNGMINAPRQQLSDNTISSPGIIET